MDFAGNSQSPIVGKHVIWISTAILTRLLTTQEFKNEDGDHTNKIEGHWKQMKASFPTHGRKKQHYFFLFGRIYLEIHSPGR